MRLPFSSRSIAKFVLLIGVLVFLLVGFLGFSHADMTMGPDGQMSSSGCFMPGMTASLCQMSPFEHIAAWQSMFTATPNQLDILALLLLLIASLAVGLLLIRRAIYPPTAPNRQSQPTYQQAGAAPFNLLQELFSSGILHPKIF